jgi:transcriptional regulator with XRE-family HTH domain
MNPAQCRAARGLLNWNQDDLAEEASVSAVTVRNFENEKSAPQRSTLDVMRRAFENAGVEFTNGGQPGVRMRSRAEKSLQSGEANGYRYEGGVEFGMRDGARIAICRVSEEALLALNKNARRDYIAVFDKNRAMLEKIAIQKFQASLMKNDIILIASSDVQSFLGR